MAFAVGDTVTWTSQAKGSTKRKTGIVAEVVRPGGIPSRERFDRLHRGAGIGLPRKHESYVVLVGDTPYWPRVTALQRVASTSPSASSEDSGISAE